MKKILSMLLGFGLVSILLYSVIYIVSTTTPSLAIPPKQVTPTPSPTPSPTPTTPPPTVTPTPTPTPTTPTTGRLEVQTIPQDDQLRKKGIIYTGFDSFSSDFHAEYKIDIRQDGVNVDADIQCIVLHKEVINPKVRQPGLISEEELTEVTDVSEFCECFFRQAPGVPGVGVIDLYCEFIGDFFLGDHILKVAAERDGAVGSEIQDLCVLAAPTCAFFPGPFIDGTQCQDFIKDEGFVFATEAGSAPLRAADALFPFASCKSAARFQRAPQPPVDPCAGCPCDFFSMPFTESCWPSAEVRVFVTDAALCLIGSNSNMPLIHKLPPCPTPPCPTLACQAVNDSLPNCPDVAEVILTAQQTAACRTCLEAYATALNDAGKTVTGGPPYECAGP